MVQLFYKPSPSPLSLSLPTVLFSSLSLPLEHLISLWSTVFLYPSLSLSISCFASRMRPPLLPCLSHHLFFCCYCLPHPLLSLPLSDLLWECYLYSNNPRRVELSRRERWREFDLPKWASPQKHNKTPLSFTPSSFTPLCFCLLILSELCCSYCAVRNISNSLRAAWANREWRISCTSTAEGMKIENVEHETQHGEMSLLWYLIQNITWKEFGYHLSIIKWYFRHQYFIIIIG